MPRHLAWPLAAESGAGVEFVDRRSGKKFEGRSDKSDGDAALRAALAAREFDPSSADGREIEWDTPTTEFVHEA